MSEYDNYKKDRQKLIEATKVRMSTPDGGAGVTKEEYVPIKPVTFKQKWDNYWYHYKWLTFGLAFAFILVFMFVWQMIFKTVYDAKLTIVTQYPFDYEIESYNEKFKDFATDFTQNDKIELDIQSLQQDYKGEGTVTPEIVQANFVKLSTGISELDGFIYLLDEPGYDKFKDMEIEFMDLSDMADASNLDKPDRYRINDTKLADKLELNDGLEDLYLCFIDFDSISQKQQNKKRIKTNYERDTLFFNELLAYK